MEKSVFISHSTKDASVAVVLRDALESNDIGCWICSRDIAGGELWNEKIVDAIEECKVFLFLMSKNSAGSKHCHKEIGLADKFNRPIVCVNIDQAELTRETEYYLSGLQMLFVNSLKLSDELGGVVKRVRNIVDGGASIEEGETMPGYDFEFRLDGKGKSYPLSAKQKLQFVEILADKDKNFKLNIKLEDDNIKAIELQCQQIEERVNAQTEVSDEDLQYMMKARKWLTRQKAQNLLKATAIKLFLGDSGTQTLCRVDQPEKAFELVKELLECDPYQGSSQKIVDSGWKCFPMEFVYSDDRMYFTAPVRSEIIAERREAMGYFCENGLLPAADLGVQYLNEILPYFYIYLASGVLSGNPEFQKPDVRNLLKYRFGFK